MKWLRYILLILTVVGITFYLVVLGGPVKNNVDFYGCSASYTYFLTNNAYCNWKTSGHCATNGFESTNAKRAIGNCLCDKRAAGGEGVGTKEMLALIQSDPFLDRDYADLKRDNTITIDSITTICSYRKILFDFYYIE